MAKNISLAAPAKRNSNSTESVVTPDSHVTAYRIKGYTRSQSVVISTLMAHMQVSPYPPKEKLITDAARTRLVLPEKVNGLIQELHQMGAVVITGSGRYVELSRTMLDNLTDIRGEPIDLRSISKCRGISVYGLLDAFVEHGHLPGMAKALGCNMNTIMERLDRLGIPPLRNIPDDRTIREQMAKEAIEKWKKKRETRGDISTRQLLRAFILKPNLSSMGRELGCTHNNISYRLKLLGVPPINEIPKDMAVKAAIVEQVLLRLEMPAVALSEPIVLPGLPTPMRQPSVAPGPVPRKKEKITHLRMASSLANKNTIYDMVNDLQYGDSAIYKWLKNHGITDTHRVLEDRLSRIEAASKLLRQVGMSLTDIPGYAPNGTSVVDRVLGMLREVGSEAGPKKGVNT